jgi:hypothetical protein
MKRTETREETLERLARDASKGKGAAKRFESLVKMAARALDGRRPSYFR